jgi:membrane protein implicated in regulation of membrane protease activity
MVCFINYISELIKSGTLFWFCALAGSGMFLIQLIVNMFGMGNGDSFDTSDISLDTIHDCAGNSADVARFKWLSFQTITGFLMMFGWMAITCQNQFGLQDSITIVVSLALGSFASLITLFVFKLAKKLKSSGSIYRIEDAIGKEGYVYQCIPKGGAGKVSLSLQNFTHEINAVSRCDKDLPSFTRVKIIEKINENTVVVSPL